MDGIALKTKALPFETIPYLLSNITFRATLTGLLAVPRRDTQKHCTRQRVAMGASLTFNGLPFYNCDRRRRSRILRIPA